MIGIERPTWLTTEALLLGSIALLAGCERKADAPTTRASAAVPSAGSSVPVPAPAVSISAPVEEEKWDEEKAKLAEPWVKAHRTQLWRLAESLTHLAADIEDGGFGLTMRPAETVGHAFARQRREARGRDYYERLECMLLRDGDYECGLTFGHHGPNYPSEEEFAVGLSLRVHPDATLASRYVKAYLAG